MKSKRDLQSLFLLFLNKGNKSLYTKKKYIVRLQKYRSILYSLKAMGFARIFSGNLADAVGVSDSQVSKDFSYYGIPGETYGYRVNQLIDVLNDIFGKTQNYKVVLVGVGKLGIALLSYNGFKKVNIEIVAAFDNSEDKTGHLKDIDIKIYPLNKLEQYVKENSIKVVIIAEPEGDIQEIYELMRSSGIEGILNFSLQKLKSSKSIIVNNVDLVLELENLIYSVNKSQGGGWLIEE